MRALISFAVVMLVASAFTLWATPYTPAIGSSERTAIANAVRADLATLLGDVARDARRGAKFVIGTVQVEGRYAFFEGRGQEINGRRTYGSVDIVAFLEKSGSDWSVLNLLVHDNVPNASQIAEVRTSLPPDYPLSIVTQFWRDQLAGFGHSN
jgi:hypothetical protein